MLSTVCFSHVGFSALLMEATVRIVYSDFMMSVLFVTFITRCFKLKATPETENHGISISELVLNIKDIQQ